MYNIMYLKSYAKLQEVIHLFKIMDTLKPENIKLNKNYIWDTLQIG